jgi:hypothetical protein
LFIKFFGLSVWICWRFGASFPRAKILLGIFFIQRKKEPFFETAEKVFRNKRSQMSGNPV